MNGQDLKNGKDLSQQVSDLANELKIELKVSAELLAHYIADRLSHLRVASAEPGYQDAVVAERDSILLYATGQTVDGADAADTKITAAVTNGLVKILVGALATI